MIFLYFPCLAGNKNANSRLFLVCLKVFLPLYYRFGRTKKVALLAALLPLWKEKTINFCLFIACLKNQHSARETTHTKKFSPFTGLNF